jgi:anti-sigma factor RsiW
MTCEDVREALPDYTLGTLSDIELAAVRRHLRGCAACRGEAATLDQGVALFASAAHIADPPPELKERVLGVLAEEWSDPVEAPPRRIPAARWWLAVAAAFVLLVGSLGFAGVAQSNASKWHDDAAAYQSFLHALGGKDVRVGSLTSAAHGTVQGSVVLYDSDVGQSWAVVFMRGAPPNAQVHVSLSGPHGRRLNMFPVRLDPEGEGSDWLVTSADISSLKWVRITTDDGRLVATGTVRPGTDWSSQD